MKTFAIGFAVGLFTGGAASYLYANYVINSYHSAAHKVGYFFQKVEGVVTAVKRSI